MPDLSAAIVARRAALGLTQEQAATRCGMTRTGWLNLEHEERDLRMSTLQRIASALDCSVVVHGDAVHLVENEAVERAE